MTSPDDVRLEHLTTQWTLVFQAHHGSPEEVSAAQTALLCRYAGAIHRYLLATLRDREAAEELDQEFALRFIRGDFHRAHPSKGRFRDFLKTAIRHLMIDHHRRRPSPRPLDGLPEPVAPDDPFADFEEQFQESWRRDLFARAWDALERLQEETGQPYHTLLKFRVAHPDLRSPELAARLAPILNKSLTAGGVRQGLLRARDQFVTFLLREVAATLDSPTPANLEQELADLSLLEYCKPALRRLKTRGAPNVPTAG